MKQNNHMGRRTAMSAKSIVIPAVIIITLMHLVQETVYDRFQVRLEPEVRIIGD